MTPQNTPAEISILEADDRKPRAAVIFDSFAIYGIRLDEPLLIHGREQRTVIALRRWPGVDTLLGHGERLIIQAFLTPDEVRSLDDTAWAHLPFEIETRGTLKLRK